MGDLINELDWMVSEVTKTRDEEGLTDNTLLIFTSDNGGMLNQGGQHALELGHRQNGNLLGFKFDAWEGGHRVPCIVRWPGKVKAGNVFLLQWLPWWGINLRMERGRIATVQCLQ